MDNIIVLTQNVILSSLTKLKEHVQPGSETLIVSTQFIFENEAEQIDQILECKCKYVNFSDLLTDAEMEECDRVAQKDYCSQNVFEYYSNIKCTKNNLIVNNINRLYPCTNKLIVCDDLGIQLEIWLDNGYKWVNCSYYHSPEKTDSHDNHKDNAILHPLLMLKRCTYNIIRNRWRYVNQLNIKVAKYRGKKYLFFGSMNRIAYRLLPEFRSAGMLEKIRCYCDLYIFNCQPKTIRMSTLHEMSHSYPDRQDLNYKILQDGYLPPNYTSYYLCYSGKNVEYWTWDKIGQKTFQYFGLPNSIIPIRRKLYLPIPVFPKTVKTVLCIASGAGDWTAIKNRSDEDKMIFVFGKLAQNFPNIEFVYRCHPVWIQPVHQGVNSIKRVAEYFDWLNFPNIKVSSNIPDGSHCLSFKRSSLEEDLKNVDIVFGEHSVGMLDAGFKKILFASVNVTGRRNLFKGVTDFGFPHCESLEELIKLLNDLCTTSFSERYLIAVDNYNKMTDEE